MPTREEKHTQSKLEEFLYDRAISAIKPELEAIKSDLETGKIRYVKKEVIRRLESIAEKAVYEEYRKLINERMEREIFSRIPMEKIVDTVMDKLKFTLADRKDQQMPTREEEYEKEKVKEKMLKRAKKVLRLEAESIKSAIRAGRIKHDEREILERLRSIAINAVNKVRNRGKEFNEFLERNKKDLSEIFTRKKNEIEPVNPERLIKPKYVSEEDYMIAWSLWAKLKDEIERFERFELEKIAKDASDTAFNEAFEEEFGKPLESFRQSGSR